MAEKYVLNTCACLFASVCVCICTKQAKHKIGNLLVAATFSMIFTCVRWHFVAFILEHAEHAEHDRQ